MTTKPLLTGQHTEERSATAMRKLLVIAATAVALFLTLGPVLAASAGTSVTAPRTIHLVARQVSAAFILVPGQTGHRLAAGKPNGDIARKLFISPKTIRNNVSSIFAKLQVADRAQAIIRAQRRSRKR